MKLSTFIAEQQEFILLDWEKFARSLLTDTMLSRERLRDHAALIMSAVAADMDTAQSAFEQSSKSRGLSPDTSPPLTSAAESHATGRMADQFSLNDLVAEFRALRASVLRRWAATSPAGEGRVAEVTRFNEAIDQALAVSMGHYQSKLEEARAVILGVLAHDLRSPLQAVSLGTQFILRSPDVPASCVIAATRTLNSVTRMKGLVQDLLDYTLTRLGHGLPIHRKAMDLAVVVRDVAEEAEVSHPGRTVAVAVDGQTKGDWDPDRVAQLLSNLLANALEHGDPAQPVNVSLQEATAGVEMTIENQGPPIDEEQRAELFQPLKNPQRRPPKSTSGSSGLGLGLYVAAQIATAHQGTIRLARSDSSGTVFAVFLPQRPPA